MKSARKVAEEMVPDAVRDGHSWRSRIEDAEDYVPLDVQPDAKCGASVVRDARGIVERLVVHERKPLAALLREVADGYRDDLARMGQLQWLGCARETHLLRMLAKVEAALDVSA